MASDRRYHGSTGRPSFTISIWKFQGGNQAFYRRPSALQGDKLTVSANENIQTGSSQTDLFSKPSLDVYT